MDDFLDLFAGAGGLSWGLRDAGLVPVAATDHWPDAAETYRRNHPDVEFLCCDVEDLSSTRLSTWLPADPAWIVGGPPCQGFSTVGKRVRTDDRNHLFLEFVRVVRHVRPDGFVLENVLGLKDMRFTDEVARVFADEGYAVSVFVLSAADFGVPQLRRRVVFVGHAEHGYFHGPWAHTTDHVTVAEAIDDLPALSPGEGARAYDRPPRTGYQTRAREGSTELQGHKASRHPEYLVTAISHIPDGGNRTAIPPALQPRSGFHNSYSRLASWRPAVAVTQNMGKPSTSRCIHPTQHRGLTTREGARLQSFPDRFHFAGPDTSQRLQVANAVPPELARRLGRALLDPACWSDTPRPERLGLSYAVHFVAPTARRQLSAG